MEKKIIDKQPEFVYADTHEEFLQKNNLQSCYDIKTMYHDCMEQKKQQFPVCEYIYSMMFICGTLEYQKQTQS